MILADTVSTGILIGLPIVAIIILLCLAWIAWSLMESEVGFAFGGAAVLVVTTIITGIATWPWKHDYHFWVPINGKVERISSRLVSAGDKGGSNQRFVVVIRGNAYGVDDTRAALLKVGDSVSLKCKKEFEWGASNNGWGCRWNGDTPA